MSTGTSASARARRLLRTIVHEKNGGRCFYCGIELACSGAPPSLRDWLVPGDNLDLQLDHAVPRARGGGDEVANRLPSCRGCNGDKGLLTVAEYRLKCGLRVQNLSFRFAGDSGAAVVRDWLCVYSEAGARQLLTDNCRGGGA